MGGTEANHISQGVWTGAAPHSRHPARLALDFPLSRRRRLPRTAFETDNSRSALATGAAPPAPKATFATASKMGSPKWLNARRRIKEQRPHRVWSYMMTAAINYWEQRMIKRVVLAMGLEDHMHTREPTKSTAISEVAAAELRRAVPADAMAVQELTRKAYAQCVPVIGREPMPMKADYDAALREHLVDLLYVDGRLAALIEIIPQANHLLIENVAVLPALQGRGLGHRLMAHGEALAISLGLSEMRLYTNKDFAANVRLYLRLGYRVDREEPFMGGTTVYMSKPLGPIASDAGPAEDVESSSTEEFVPAPIKPTIAISDLDKLDIRVGMIETVEFVAASDTARRCSSSTSHRARWRARFPRRCSSISATPMASLRSWQSQSGQYQMGCERAEGPKNGITVVRQRWLATDRYRR